MKIKCTGILQQAGSSEAITGINTKFLAELCPGDVLDISGISYTISTIFSDNLLVINSLITITINTEFFITDVNPYYRLTGKQAYIMQYIDTGYYNNGVVHNGRLISDGDITTNVYNNPKYTYLPYGYEYIMPYERLSMCQTTENSAVLSIPDLNVYLSVTSGYNSISLSSGSGLLDYLIVGFVIKLKDTEYKVIKRVNSISVTVYFDKEFNFTANKVKLEIPARYNEHYPAGSIIQVNGKIYKVKNATSNSIQLDYPISDSAIVFIKKPLVGTLMGKNSVVFSNIDTPQEYVKQNNLLLVHEIRDENSLYGNSIVYNELKSIARNYSTHIVSNENNIRQFSGIVCFGVPLYGKRKIFSSITADSTSSRILISSSGIVNRDNIILPITGAYLQLGDTIHKVTSHSDYTYISTNQISIYVSPAKANGSYDVYECSHSTLQLGYYSATIRALCLKLVSQSINYGTNQIASLDMLYKLYAYSIEFSVNLFAKKAIVYSQFEPLQFAVNKVAAQPTSFEQLFGIVKYGSSSTYVYSNVIITRCGQYIRTPK